MPEIYCADTSALVDLTRNYPRTSFGALWLRLGALAEQNRLIAPREVYRELSKKEDDVFAWAGENGGMFSDPDDVQQGYVREMLQRFPKWVDPTTERPVADPFVIAMARRWREIYVETPCVVIVHEDLKGPGAVRIPNVCRDYGIPYVRLPALIVREGWTFA